MTPSMIREDRIPTSVVDPVAASSILTIVATELYVQQSPDAEAVAERMLALVPVDDVDRIRSRLEVTRGDGRERPAPTPRPNVDADLVDSWTSALDEHRDRIATWSPPAHTYPSVEGRVWLG